MLKTKYLKTVFMQRIYSENPPPFHMYSLTNVRLYIYNIIKKTPTQVFSVKNCEIFETISANGCFWK